MPTEPSMHLEEEYITNIQRHGLVILAFLTPIGLVGFLIYRAYLHPLSTVPGPALGRVSGFYRTYYHARGNWHDQVVWLHKRYGRVVRIGPDEISIVDQAAIRKIYGLGPDNAAKAPWYRTWELNGRPDPFNVRDTRIHSLLRRRVSSAYAMSSILHYEPYIQECLDICFSKWRKLAADCKSIEVTEWTHALAFDIISELVCGTQMGHLVEEKDVFGVRGAIQAISFIVNILGDFPTQSSLLQHPITMFIQSRILGLKNPVEQFFDFLTSQLYARMSGTSGSNRKDMLSHFMAATPTEKRDNQSRVDNEVLRDMQTAL
jgi:cytochrome P450